MLLHALRRWVIHVTGAVFDACAANLLQLPTRVVQRMSTCIHGGPHGLEYLHFAVVQLADLKEQMGELRVKTQEQAAALAVALQQAEQAVRARDAMAGAPSAVTESEQTIKVRGKIDYFPQL